MALSKRTSSVPRVRSGAAHRATLVTTWRVQVTGIEFIDDYPMDANGRNKSDTDPDRQHYPDIHEDFGGWGRGMPLTGWDWEGADNLERAACYHRQKPIRMRVRLRSSLPAPSARSFKLTVTPKVDGDASVLTPATITVDWPAGAQEWPDPAASDSDRDAKAITTGGALPNEVSRYHVQLTWSVSDITPGGTINVTNHKIFGIYEAPLDPNDSSPSGVTQSSVDGLTKQRLDKLTLAIAGAKRRFPTPAKDDVHRLIWKVCQAVNNSGLTFYGGRNPHLKYGVSGPELNYLDNWLMWLRGAHWIQPDPNKPKKPWNVGACITYVQTMKTMLAAVGINARRAWVYPKTTRLPNGSTISLPDSQLVAIDDSSPVEPQSCMIPVGTHSYPAEAVLVGAPEEDGFPYMDGFEACLYYDGNLVPGAFATTRYPGEVAFTSALQVLRWWAHGKGRFMVWLGRPNGKIKYFDVDGKMYSSPYAIPANKRLPVP